MQLLARSLITESIGRVIRAAIVNIRFWYFTDIDALGQNAIGAMDPSRVPNALVGHHWTFLFVVVVTAAALPYSSQVASLSYLPFHSDAFLPHDSSMRSGIHY